MRELQGEITISRPHCSDGTKKITIQLIDSTSRTRVTEISMSYADFAETITGMSRMPCTFEWDGAEAVGMKKETKSVFVTPVPQWIAYKDRTEEGRKILEPYEADGWRGSVYDLFNSKNESTQDGVRGVRVGFVRYVEADGENES